MDIALKQMSNCKSPGIDGLSTEFLKHFWKDIRKLLYNAFLECIQEGSLSPTMKTGLITLLPKPKKQLLLLDNWRPITLLCTDYKLLALVYANRLKLVLGKLVEEYQSAFIKGRYIQNHIRLILDMIDYQSLIQSESLILFIDFLKHSILWSMNLYLRRLECLVLGKGFARLLKCSITTFIVIYPLTRLSNLSKTVYTMHSNVSLFSCQPSSIKRNNHF